MVRATGAACIAAFFCLVAARFVTSGHWITLLWGAFFFAALGVGLVLGLLLRRGSPNRWHAHAAAILGLCAAGGRLVLTYLLTALPTPTATIQPTNMFLAAWSLTWAGLALLWGVHGLSLTLERPAGHRMDRPAVGLSLVGTATALYALAPLRGLLNLGINHWTVLGLVALVVIAYGGTSLYRATQRRR